jgi:biopolymer transport protein ExbB
VWLGSISALGVSDNAAGALAPAGEGKLKVWNRNSASTARALATGQQPPTLDLFLFESLEKNVDPKATQSFLQFMEAGGPVGWVIFFLGALAALLIVGRIALLAEASLRSRGLVARVQRLNATHGEAPALEACHRSGGPLGRVLGVAFANLKEERQKLEDRLSEAMLREQSHLGRFTSTIMVLAAVSPLLGLLGTVTGMISTFDIITEHGTGDPKLLSSGISEALITTELGLIVAIPALLIGTLLASYGRSLESRLEQGVLTVLNAASGMTGGAAGGWRTGQGAREETKRAPTHVPAALPQLEPEAT